ncbi:MAG: DMT family transporter [Alistipes sp.]|nr:DMT family transporter [Alistipes sp.]
MRGNKILGIICAVIASGTFGLIPLFSIPLIRSGMAETSILFYRCLFSAIAVGTLCAAGRKDIRIGNATALRLSGMAVLNCATAVALLLSYNFLSSGVVTSIHFLYPVVVALLMVVVYKEKCPAGLLVAAGVTLFGVASMSWTGGGFTDTRGVLLALSTAFSYALYIVGLNQEGLASLDSRVVMFHILLVSALIFGVISLSTGGIDPIPGAGAWINLLLLAALPTIVSNIALLKAVKYAGPTTTSILGSAEPLVAVFFGVSMFSEKLTMQGIVGLAAIIAAVTYVIVSGAGKKSYA